MNWTAIKGTFTCIALIAVSFLALTVAHDEHVAAKHATELMMRAGDAEDQVNITLKKLNAPGGLLQVTGKAVAKADNVLGHTDILIANEQTSLNQWNKQITETLGNVNTTIAATTDAENKITKGSVETLSATTDALKALKPVEQQLATEVDALHTATVGITAMLPDVQATAKNVNGMTSHGNAILGDGQTVTDKLTKDFMTPVPWWKKPFKYIGDFWDISAAVARHTP